MQKDYPDYLSPYGYGKSVEKTKVSKLFMNKTRLHFDTQKNTNDTAINDCKHLLITKKKKPFFIFLFIRKNI